MSVADKFLGNSSKLSLKRSVYDSWLRRPAGQPKKLAVQDIAAEFGISGMQITMAAFMGQAIRYGSPTVAWLFLLIDRTEMNFGDYLKTFMKYALPMFVLFIITALVLGLFPL